MRKWISSGLVLVLALAGVWYFLIKSYDYKISFQTTAAPGTIYLRALHWKPERTSTIEKVPYHELTQKLDLQAKPVNLKWEFTPVNDTSTRVEAFVKVTDNIFTERLKLLVGQSAKQEKMAGELESFRDLLEKDDELFYIKVTGEALVPESLCACISLESQMEKKATGMMQNIGLLQEYMRQHELELQGKPRVKVSAWNTNTNQIKFDFCFPLSGEKNLPDTAFIQIKKIPSQKALKAIFRGNYIFSHHAWLQLLNYAEIHGYEMAGQPMEVFIDNPELGGDSRNWEAEVYLPVK